MEDEIARLRRFQDFLRAEDKLVFSDLLDQCKFYASYAGTIASSVREVPLLLSMLFGEHKKMVELEKRVLLLETIAKTHTRGPGDPQDDTQEAMVTGQGK